MKRALAIAGVLGALCLAAFRYPSGDIPVTPSAGGGGNANVTWPLVAPSDSVSAPDFAWNGNAATGLYQPVSGAFAATVGGNEVMRWSYDPVNGGIVTLNSNYYDGASPLLRFGSSTANAALLAYPGTLWVRSGDGFSSATLKAKNMYAAGSDATSGDSLSGWGGHVAAGSLQSFRFNTSSRITDIGDGAISLTTNAGGAFSKLIWGAVSSSVPMLKASGSGLAVRLGDDSGVAAITAGAATLTSNSVSANETVGGTLSVTGTTTVSKVQNANGTASAPTYTFSNSTGTGVWVDATVNALAQSVNGTEAAYVSASGEMALPLSNTTFPNNVSGLRLGNLDSTGIKIFRNGSGVLQVGLADGSANGSLRGARFQTTNLDGTTQFSSSVTSDVAGMRLYYDTSAIAANTYALLAQQRILSPQKTSAYTVVKADSGKRFSNAAATAQVVFTLPPATGVGSFTSTNGAEVPFVVFVNRVSFGLQIKAQGSDVLQFPGSASSAGGTQTTTSIGGSVRIFACDAAVWCTEGGVGGTWTGA